MTESNRASKGATTTLTDYLCYRSNRQDRLALDQFRKDFEAIHGPTDLTKAYTSMWPEAVQRWLYEHEPGRWLDGLPPFAQAFFRERVVTAGEDGALTTIGGHSDEFIEEMKVLIGGPACPRRSSHHLR